jgi:Coenzyme PQQ synthesis protein D (PqqD)
MTSRFCVDSANAIAEKIEGEVVIINLGTGAYYSLRAVGADVWSAIEGGATQDEIVDSLAARYDGDSSAIGDYVAGLLEELQAEGLVRAAGEDAVRPAPVGEAPSGGREPFAPAPLEKHTDMQDLILIDPVHEVDARGWPHTAEAAERP